MGDHIFFALKMAWRFRTRLREYKYSQALHCASVLALDPDKLKASGVVVLVLDFDGVLASHGEESLPEETMAWLRRCLQVWPASSIFILSNRPTPLRAQFFSKHFPGVQCVRGVRKKPYPDGIVAILEATHLPPDSVCVIDDRLFTGILASLIVGTRGYWITDPLIAYQKRPITESFFTVLRWFERWVLH